MARSSPAGPRFGSRRSSAAPAAPPLIGTYSAPAVKVGQRVACLFRDRDCKATSISDAPTLAAGAAARTARRLWPVGQRRVEEIACIKKDIMQQLGKVPADELNKKMEPLSQIEATIERARSEFLGGVGG